MKSKWIGLCAFFWIAGAFRTVPAQNADEIVRRADRHLRGSTSISEITMKIVRPDWSREMTMKAWEKGRELSLVVVHAPARDRGMAFLKRGTEVWNWIPSIEKVIKIPPSMMMQSWLGSDFTNDDLVRESSIVHDYTHRIVGDSTLDGRACYKIELMPKPEASVVWGKQLVWITKENDLQMKIDFFDEDGNRIHVLRFSQIREMGGRLIPTVMKMTPIDKPDHNTVITYLSVEFDKPIADSFFSEQNLKRVR